MIDYHYETQFELESSEKYTEWLEKVALLEGYNIDTLNYIFCSDEQLLDVNIKYLGHDFYTDIITFEYGENNSIFGDVFISVERVKENAMSEEVDFENELRRVMCHGLLHMMGYGDKSETQKREMREAENKRMMMFHVEQ